MTEQAQILAVLHRFIEGGLIEQDIDKVLSCLTEPLLGIGIGEQGFVTSLAEVCQVISGTAKTEEEDPYTHRISYGRTEVLLHAPQFATICAEVTVTAEDRTYVRISESRFSQLLSLIRKEEGWKVCALHASTPIVTEETLDAYPLKIAEKTLQSLREKIGEQAYQQEERFRQAVLADTIAFYIINFTKDEIEKCQLNGEYCAYTEPGTAYDSFVHSRAPEFVVPEDMQAFYRCFTREHVLSSFRSGQSEVSLEYRLKLRSDGYLWVVTVCRLIVDEKSGDQKGIMYVRNIDKSKREEIALQARANRDGMTGLYNKDAMVRLLRRHLARKPEAGGVFIMLDVDDFKSINDAYGHPLGDKVLVAVADILTSAVRQSDLVSRLGGDEFALFLSGVQDKDRVQEMLYRILSRFNAIWVEGAPGLRVSCSIGATSTLREDTFEDLYRKADSALYLSKKNGKNQSSFA